MLEDKKPLAARRQETFRAHFENGSFQIDMNNKPIDKEQALAKARRMAEEVYGDLSAYQVKVGETEDKWQFEFSQTPSQEDGGRQHFAVWVDKQTGEARLFKGR